MVHTFSPSTWKVGQPELYSDPAQIGQKNRMIFIILNLCVCVCEQMPLCVDTRGSTVSHWTWVSSEEQQGFLTTEPFCSPWVFSFRRNCQAIFQGSCAMCTPASSKHSKQTASWSSLGIVCLFFISQVCPISWCNLHFLIVNGTEHFFKCSLATHRPFLASVFILCLLLNWVV